MKANGRELKDVLLGGETLTVEFKSDTKPLPDRQLVAAVVALTNTEGGDLYLGVEDDGTVTGVHPNHQDVSGLGALIANRTNPPVTVRTELFDVDDKPIVVVQVPKTRSIVSTSEGLLLRHEEQTGTAMPIDSLIILSRLRHERRLTTVDLTADIQKSEQATRTALEKLVEAGLVEAHGTGRGRTYTLSAKVYRHAGQKAAYVRQAGFDSIQHEQMVLAYLDKHGSIKRADVMELCRITKDQAAKLLQRLKTSGKVIQHGERRGAYYERKL